MVKVLVKMFLHNSVPIEVYTMNKYVQRQDFRKIKNIQKIILRKIK